MRLGYQLGKRREKAMPAAMPALGSATVSQSRACGQGVAITPRTALRVKTIPQTAVMISFVRWKRGFSQY
jgi:hypothetical protein